MLQILKAYADILFFRRGPDCLPQSLPLFVITLAADAALTILAIALLGADLISHVLQYVLSLIMLFSVVWILLNALELDDRFLQAITALLGADLYLTLIQVTVGITGGDLQSAVSAEDVPMTLLALTLVQWWWFGITGFVIKRAGGLTVLASIGVVFAIFVLSRGASSLLFG